MNSGCSTRRRIPAAAWPDAVGWWRAMYSRAFRLVHPAPVSRPRSHVRRAPPASARGRKNMRLDQALLDSAKRVPGTESETEAATLALQRVVDNARVADGIRALGGRRMFDESRTND